MRIPTEQAVSPVVGVMMMLVVVIIIAAIVSGFAGSMVSSTNKVPQATIQGTYSQSSKVLQMYHAGGDELATQRIFVLIRVKDEQVGGFAGSMARSSTNKSNICDLSGTKCWLSASKGTVSDVPVWISGQTMYYTGDTGLGFTPDDTIPVGSSFTLEIDTIDGKLVSKTDVKVLP
ncbi:MAG: type IV pilin [Methanomicrobiales archaeon]|nr:type IV pilin [Methanomicrobiales archaeon]